jgi:hypothetical protein
MAHRVVFWVLCYAVKQPTDKFYLLKTCRDEQSRIIPSKSIPTTNLLLCLACHRESETKNAIQILKQFSLQKLNIEIIQSSEKNGYLLKQFRIQNTEIILVLLIKISIQGLQW